MSSTVPIPLVRAAFKVAAIVARPQDFTLEQIAASCYVEAIERYQARETSANRDAVFAARRVMLWTVGL